MKKLRYVPAIVWMTVLFIFSAQTGSELDNDWLPWVQKALPGLQSFNPMHYVSYFVLGLTIAYAIGRSASSWLGGLAIVAICTAYGVTDEWHQSFVPMRTPDVNDLLHDTIGAAAAYAVVAIGAAIRRRNRSKYYTDR